ncbi:hypothetical protein Syun_029848 [Stephania yunnanensis]|uniref:Uncharacterized protein n=1 Tax=Stephania yunnanensis TaxID=152371 RepID=A0AAP0E6C4_9MAGN
MDIDVGMDSSSNSKQGEEDIDLRETVMSSGEVSDKESQNMEETPSYKERLVRDTIFGAGIQIPIEEGDLLFGTDDKGKFLRTSTRLQGITMEPYRVEYPWLAIGDFNVYLTKDEKKGGAAPNLRNCKEFSSAIDQ